MNTRKCSIEDKECFKTPAQCPNRGHPKCMFNIEIKCKRCGKLTLLRFDDDLCYECYMEMSREVVVPDPKEDLKTSIIRMVFDRRYDRIIKYNGWVEKSNSAAHPSMEWVEDWWKSEHKYASHLTGLYFETIYDRMEVWGHHMYEPKKFHNTGVLLLPDGHVSYRIRNHKKQLTKIIDVRGCGDSSACGRWGAGRYRHLKIIAYTV